MRDEDGGRAEMLAAGAEAFRQVWGKGIWYVFCLQFGGDRC